MIVDIETERYILGSMTQGSEYLSEGLAELLEDDFFKKEHKVLFTLIGNMYRENEPVTEESFYIKHSDKLREMGINWVKFTDVFATMINFKAAWQKLKSVTKARKLMAMSDNIRKKLESGTDVPEILEEIAATISGIEGAGTKRQYLTPKELALACFDSVSARMDQQIRKGKCIYTGFKKLNQVTGGLENGDLIILSGSTGGGKSAFVSNIARDVSMVQKAPCLYINSEMSAAQMALRWSALLGEISHSNIRAGVVSQKEFSKLTAKLDMVNNSGLYTLTMPDLRVDAVINEIRRYKARYDIRLAIVDYIGRMDFVESKSRDDWQLLTGAARRLKTLAQERDIVVIMLAQLNAYGQLAQASYMAHEADLWLNIRKPTDDEEAEFAMKPWNVILQINKARNAATGAIPMFFWGDRLLFTDDIAEAEYYAKMAKQSVS